MHIRVIGAALLLGLLAAGSIRSVASQSNAGAIAAVSGNRLLEILPAGTVTTVLTASSGVTLLGLCPSLDNSGVVVLEYAVNGLNRVLRVVEVKQGVPRVLGTFPAPGTTTLTAAQGGVLLDQGGDYITASPYGVHRFLGIGGLVITLDTNRAAGVTENLTPGGWLTFSSGVVHALTRSGKRSRIASVGGLIASGKGGITADTRNGNAFPVGSRVYYLDVQNARVSTFATGAPLSNARSIDVDPLDGSLVVGDISGVYRLDRQGRVIATVARVLGGVTAITVIGSNNLGGLSAPRAGAAYNLNVSFPRFPGKFYEVGASFGYQPGIRTPHGTVPLNPDPLFSWSKTDPFTFARFSGTLGQRGGATATFRIPNAQIQGVRFFLAALAYDSTGVIHIISEPRGVTIE